MSKIQKEDCLTLSIFKLKGWGYLSWACLGRGNVKWTNSWGDESNISFSYNLVNEANMFIELDYRTKSWGDEDYVNVNHRYPIVATPCNFRGQRPWFICSVYRSGVYCGRRVAKLYKGGGSHYFACRHCYNLTYRSRIASCGYTESDVEVLGNSIKRWYYRGKPTKKHRRYIKIKKAVENDWGKLFIRIAKRIGK